MKPNVCRCCLTVACYKDLSNEYYYGGRKEVYAEILLETFNITISDTTYKRLICEECISKLRAAAAFKQQVLDAEETLKVALLSKTDEEVVEAVVEPKEELDCLSDDHMSDGISNHSLVESDDFDDKIDWDNQKIGEEEGEIFVIKLEPNNKETNKKKAPLKKPQKAKQVSTMGNKKCRSRRKDGNNEDSQALKNLIENSLKLILNSNVCLFESLRTSYKCFLCRDNFTLIKDLREHSKTHADVKLIKNRFHFLRGKTYRYVDISNLQCKICTEKCTDLNDLKQHLVSHDVKFHDNGHFLIPYRLEKEFKCVMCEQMFQTFTRLSIHMNSHYTNNVCEICGISFISRLSLRSHLNQVHREKKCTMCSATFPNNHTRIKHMRKVHKTPQSKRYCLVCNKTFKYTHLLFEHKVKEHGAKRQISACSECDKVFLSPNNLKTHVRSVHIRERNYPCSICGLGFFTKCDQKRHERTHEDVRSFSCNYCEGRFKSKDSWRRHLKRQHGQLYCNKDTYQ